MLPVYRMQYVILDFSRANDVTVIRNETSGKISFNKNKEALLPTRNASLQFKWKIINRLSYLYTLATCRAIQNEGFCAFSKKQA